MTERVEFPPEWWMPRAWTRNQRRAFLLTLPISGPLWLALVVAIHRCGCGIYYFWYPGIYPLLAQG